MRNIELPVSFVKLIFEFENIFSKPNFKYFLKVISGLILGRPKKTITSIIRVHNFYDKFYNVHRFLNKYKWDYHTLGFTMLKILIEFFHLKELTIALDDTLVMKYGKCIYGRAIHAVHSKNPNMPKYIYGHNWVVFGLMHHLRVFKKWFCFPFLSKLFIPKNYFTDLSLFKSRIDLAIEILKMIKKHTNLPITLVADGLYAKQNIVRYCIENSITFISRFRKDVALYRPAVKPKILPQGRPKKYGKKISMKKLSHNEKQFDTMNLNLYGKEKTIKVRTIKAYWKRSGHMVKVFIVKFTENKKETVSYFFSTDLNISTEKAIELVAARWSIETSFKDLKEHLGLNDWQVRKEKPVTRSATLNCIALSLLTLWTYQESNKKQLDLWDILPWYKQKNSVCLQNMIQLFKNKCISININYALSEIPISKQKKKQILEICRLAA